MGVEPGDVALDPLMAAARRVEALEWPPLQRPRDRGVARPALEREQQLR